jgi:hypothetical protein
MGEMFEPETPLTLRVLFIPLNMITSVIDGAYNGNPTWRTVTTSHVVVSLIGWAGILTVTVLVIRML